LERPGNTNNDVGILDFAGSGLKTQGRFRNRAELGHGHKRADMAQIHGEGLML